MYIVVYIVVYMPRVNIYIPAMKLRPIDLYCKDRGIARGVLLANAALSVINARGEGIKCEFMGCHNPALGKYIITIYSTELGEDTKTLNLCEPHYLKAKKEGTVKEA